MARRRGIYAVTVNTSHEPDDGPEVDIEVECEITPGERPTGPTYSCGGTPGCGPEVEILSAVDDAGKDWTEEINADRNWLAFIEEQAIEAYGDEREAAKEEAADRAYDEWRDRRAERD